MVFDRSKLPRDPEKLKDYIMAFAEDYTEKEGRIEELTEELKNLGDQYAYLQHLLFGRMTEKTSAISPEQMALFGNDEESEVVEGSDSNSTDDVTVPEHQRKRGGRKPLPEHLPRRIVELDIPEEERICGCGCSLEIIRTEITEKLNIIPEQFEVVEFHRPVRACKNCEGSEDEGPAVKIAPPAPTMLPKSIATDALTAYILYSKFAEGIPFYRLEQRFQRKGVEVSRANMANWTMKIAKSFRGIYNLFRDHVLESDIINVDETRHKVLEELKRRNETQWCQMWVFLRSNGTYPVVYYQYEDNKGKKVPMEFFDGYKGYIQSDSFASYDFLGMIDEIIHLHCWFHARRNFVKIIKALEGKGKKKKKKKKKKRPPGLADEAIKYIAEIYKIEKKHRGKSPEEIYEARQRETKPLLVEFHEWLEDKKDSAPPSGYLGKAINYCLNHWDNLNHFLEDGRLRPDNNSVENAIRPFVIGRKNWLFSDTIEGAESSAILYSIVETAKANGLDPHKYFLYAFARLPHAETLDDLESLLPWNLTPEQIA